MKKHTMKRWLGILLAVAVIFSSFAYGIPNMANVVEAAEVSRAGTNDYGLCDNIQDGTILHCFDWKYSDIEAELENIAEAGFTSIQTSPAQRDDGGDRYIWYMLYQPQSFAIATNPLGSKAELESLCKKAEEYGIKVIVDVVANHTRGMGGENGDVDANLKKRDFFRYGNLDSNQVDWKNRGQVWSCNIGMRDLVSENTELQSIISGYIDELKSVGVDGIRWDAAKHIQLPSEGGNQFWPKVTSQGLFHYGEILEGPDDRESGNESLMKEYTNYMTVTDNGYGSDLTGNFRDGKVIPRNGKWVNKNAGITANKLLYWAESHDTYANEYNNEDKSGWTKYIDQNVIDRAYAIVGSRAGATALYFSRPFKTAKAEIKAGEKGSTHFTSKEVAEVNHLHNACVGEKEYYVGDESNNVAAVCRESGAVVVLGSGGNRNVTVQNGGGTVKPGTYVDAVSGGEWTVTSTTMSGQVGDKGIAVFYKAEPIVKTPTPTISKEGGNFSDTLTLTIGLKNATSGTYQIGNEAAKTYTSSQTITIGSGMEFGDSVTITLTATDGAKTETKTYTFTKVDKVINKAYLSLPSGWSEPVYCYAYDSATEKITNGEWPGVQMTKDSATGYYVYEIPENIEKPRVVFYSSDINRYPADMEKGLQFAEDGSYLYKDGKWAKYTQTVQKGKVIVKHVDTAGTSVANQQTLQGDVGTKYTTTAASVAGYRLKETPSNASGTYTSADITVTYIYEKVESNVLDVASSLAEGAVFETETTTITLTAQNATSATYSVDDGPVKTFSNSTQVVIGQGKIADRDVTVKVTATNGTDTVNKTFTYKKKFNGNVVNENNVQKTAAVMSKAVARAGASGTLASQYSTNKTGMGVEKTISVDGSISDWDSSMLIAQGAANDDPRVYRPNSMYEVPVDLYALYGAYDDNNIYLMWEMTNVQDVVAPKDDYPISQGILWQTAEFPFFIAIDTGKSDAVGNKGALTTGGTIWNSGMTIENRFNRLISINTKGGNGPFVYGGDSNGLNSTELLEPGTAATKSNITMKYGKGILSSQVNGIDGAYGENNNRVVGDIYNNSAAWVDFNTKNHNSASMDFFYELAIPYEELGITKNDVKQNGVGVLLVATMGLSALDCLPYDGAMNDNADLDDSAGSQENNSFEKSDEDHITCSFARIGKAGDPNPNPNPNPNPVTDLTVNFGADRSSPQLNTTNLTLKAIASGGKSAYQYEFFVDGVSVQSKSSTDSYTWKPSAGNHTIKVTVTDSNGNTVSSQKAYVIEGNGGGDEQDINMTGFTANPSSGVYKGSSVNLAANATGGTGTLQYKFTAQLENGSESTIQDYGTTNTATWIPQTAGRYTLKVYVKDSSSKSGEKTITNYEVKDNDSVDIRISFTDSTKKYVYDGTEKKPEVTVMDGTRTLVKDTDYRLLYDNNINAGDKDSANAPKVTIVGEGDYAAKIERETLTFTIEKAEKPAGAPNSEMTVAVGPVTDLILSAGWEWSDSSRNVQVQEGTSVSVEAVYNGTDKENYKTTTVSVRLTGISCNHVGTEQETITTKNATCTQKGSRDVICKRCNKKIRSGEEIPALGHTGGTATCISQATCGRCGEKYGTFDLANHVNQVVENRVAANCQQAGYTGDIKCRDCNTLVSAGKPVSKTAHVEDGGKVTKAPTATADGVRTYACIVCKKEIRTEVIPKTGGGTTTEPGTQLKAGDPVEDAASKGIYKVTKADPAVKTVQFVLPSGNVKDVNIPDHIVVNGTAYQVTSVADGAFKNNKTVQTVKMGSSVKTIGENAFSGCTNLKKVTFSNNTTTIGNGAFYKCTKLTNVTIPNKVSKIGDKAFYGCSGLKKVTISKNTTKIGSMAFYKCTKLTSITIPAKVNKIGSKAFYGCKKLKKITIKTTKLTNKKVGSQAFKGIAAKATIKVPKKKLTAYKKLLRTKGVGSKAKIKK